MLSPPPKTHTSSVCLSLWFSKVWGFPTKIWRRAEVPLYFIIIFFLGIRVMGVMLGGEGGQ